MENESNNNKFLRTPLSLKNNKSMAYSSKISQFCHIRNKNTSGKIIENSKSKKNIFEN